MEENKIIEYEGDSIVKHVSSSLRIANKLLLPNLKSLRVLHLDDHKLFAQGVLNCVRRKFPNILIKHIQNGDAAIDYVKDCFALNDFIDLIITDIIHPGLDGISFSKNVRELEKDKQKYIPIIFITFMEDISIRKKAEEIPFIKYLVKSQSCEEICLAINNYI